MSKVLNHEYWGNLCSGFGGRTVCENMDPDTGVICGRDKFDHDYDDPAFSENSWTIESIITSNPELMQRMYNDYLDYFVAKGMKQSELFTYDQWQQHFRVGEYSY